MEKDLEKLDQRPETAQLKSSLAVFMHKKWQNVFKKKLMLIKRKYQK